MSKRPDNALLMFDRIKPVSVEEFVIVPQVEAKPLEEDEPRDTEI